MSTVATKTRRDVYQDVTDRIVAALENGEVAPWRKPWRTLGGPVNVRTGTPYRGINIFLLALAGYGDPRWGTYKAISEAGGQVRKGEKGTRIILWKPIPKKVTDENGEEQDESYLLLRDYVVFNAEQADGLPPLPVVEENVHTPNERAEEALKDYLFGGPAVMFGGDRAAYSPLLDNVYMPHPEQFFSPESFYSTYFHELTHSTGHISLLKRIEPAIFGSDPYAREELVAEMGAAMLCGVTGIENLDQSAAYLKGWLPRLRDDRKLVVHAAAQAQKAIDLILGTKFGDEASGKDSA